LSVGEVTAKIPGRIWDYGKSFSKYNKLKGKMKENIDPTGRKILSKTLATILLVTQ
jgi:hypothetical protein